MTHTQRRLRVLSRAAVYGAMKHRHRVKKRHFVAVQATLLALIIASSAVMQVYFDIKPIKVEVNQRALGLLNETRDDAKEYLKLDSKTGAYSFEVPKVEASEDASTHTGRNADAYSASFPSSSKEGVSVTDTNTQIVFNIAPKFVTSQAHKTDDNRIIYTHGSTQLVYTLQYNGLKEDIIIPQFLNDSLDYEFELRLPSGVEARLDEQGNIGLYSADTTLYGQISYGSDDDRARIDKARENGEKTNLVATIPYPIIKDASGKEHNDRSKFVLGDKQMSNIKDQKSDPTLPAEVAAKLATKTTQNTYDLKIESTNLKDLPYPISIDPTIKVSSAGDFNNVNVEGGTQVDTTNNLIKRSSLSGGVLPTLSNTVGENYPANRSAGEGVAYNGFLYVVGEDGGLTNVRFSKINTDGSLSSPAVGSCSGVWCLTISVIDGSLWNQVIAYNGYIYTIGCYCGTAANTNQYAKINANGTLSNPVTPASSTWQTTTNTGSLMATTAVAVNGWMYQMGGSDVFFTAAYNTVMRSPIAADGSLGTWVSTGMINLPQLTRQADADYYNGRIYITGGGHTTVGTRVDVYSIGLNSDGSMQGSAWLSTSSMNEDRANHQVQIVDGYIYAIAGFSNGAPTTAIVNTIEYAQINADGSVGTWRYTGSGLGAGNRWGHASMVYNNWIYTVGGCAVGGCTTAVSHTERAQIKPAGETGDWTTLNNTFTGARSYAAATVYNGFLYVSGGCTDCSNGFTDTYLNTVQYAPINADGSLGAWAAGANFANPRAKHDMVTYNGFMYIVGGRRVDLSQTATFSNIQRTAINADGSLAGWSSTTVGLNSAREDHATAVHNGYMYVIGGFNATPTMIQTYMYAPIQADGNITTAFVTDNTNTLSEARIRMEAAVYNGKIYIAGGCITVNANKDCTGDTDTVSYATVSSGPTGAWTNNAVGIGYDVYDYGGLSVFNGYLYVVGGQSVGGEYDTTKYARIKSDGTVDTWEQAISGVEHRSDNGTTVGAGYIYTVGGDVSRSYSYAPINNGGSGKTVNHTATPTSQGNRVHHTSAILNGYIYIIGGCSSAEDPNNCTPTNNVSSASIGADGSVGAWAFNSFIPVAGRKYHGGFTYNGRLYVLGGCTVLACNTYTRDVSFATSNPSTGALTWDSSLSADLPCDYSHTDFTAYDGYAYRSGTNVCGLNDTGYAQINSSTGAIGSWSNGTNFPGADRSHNRIETYKGYVYSFGGIIGQSTNEVQRSQIQSDHSLGTWSLVSRLPVRVHAASTLMYNGYAYVAGGFSNFADTTGNAVYRAAILPDGYLGDWDRVGTLNTARIGSGQSIQVYKGKFYLTGGQNGATQFNHGEYFTPEIIPRIGSFSRLYNFEAGVKPTKLITRGTKQTDTLVPLNYQTTNNTSSTLGSAITSSNLGFTGANALTFSLGSSTLSQYLFLRYTIDDTMSAVFPDSGNESTITDFDVYYRANTAKRLKGGRTFTNGADRGLDAQF